MAIFTGLDDTLKETLNVDYNERTTDQKVKFLNKENEYWGRFNGAFSPTSLSVESGSLSNVTLYNARLLTTDGREIDVSKYGQDLADLQTDVENLQEEIEDKCESIDGKIGNISANTEFQVKNACTALSIDIQQGLTRQVEDLGTNLTHYIERRATDISSVMDAKIEAAKTLAQSKLDLSVQQLIHTDRISAHMLLDEINEIQSYTDLSVSAIASRVDNAFQTIMGPVELSVAAIKSGLDVDVNKIQLSVETLVNHTEEKIDDIHRDLDLSVADITRNLSLSVETGKQRMDGIEEQLTLSVQNLEGQLTLSVQNLVGEDEYIKSTVAAANSHITDNERATAVSAFNLDQKAEENARRIEEVNRVLSGKIDANYVKLSENYVNDADFLRHYKLKNVNTAAEFLNVEDYAINVIEDDVVDGYLTKDGVKYGKIETIERGPDGKITSFRLVIFDGENIPQELGVGAFLIKPFETTKTGFGEYYYTWNIEGDGTELRGKLRVKSESSYKYCMASDSNLSLYINYPEFNGGVISAGYVVVESNKSDYMDLVNLTKDGRTRFDQYTSIISSNGCGLSYHGDNVYGLSTNIVHYPYFAVEDGAGTVARIPSETVIRDEETSELLSCVMKHEGRSYTFKKSEDTGIYESLISGATFYEYDPTSASVTTKTRLSAYTAIDLAPADGDLIIHKLESNSRAEEATEFEDLEKFTITFGEMLKPQLSAFNGLVAEVTKTDGAWNTATLVAAGSTLNISVEDSTFVFKHLIASGTEITRRLDFSFADFDFIDTSIVKDFGIVDWSAERDDPSMDEVILTVDTSRIYSKGELYDQQLTLEPSVTTSLKVAVADKKIDDVDIFDSGRVREFAILFKLAGAVEKDVPVEFYDERGAAITVITDKHTAFKVKSGRVPEAYTFYKFVEVAKDKFLAFNMNFDKMIRDIIATKEDVRDLSAAIDTEVARATAAETLETSRATAAEAELSAELTEKIDNEIARALSAEETLSADYTELISAEATTRAEQIAGLSARIKGGINYQGFIKYMENGEGQAPKSLSALFANNGYTAPFYKGYQYRVSLDESVFPYYELPHNGITLENGDDIYFKEDVEAIEDVEASDIDIDHNVNANIVTQTQLNLSVTTINGRLDSLDLSAETLDHELNEEVGRALSAEADLNTAIIAETDRALSAEGELEAEISELSAGLREEISRATAAESSITSMVSTEAARALAAEAELSAQLTEKIEAEESRATAAEETITERFDTVFEKTTCEGGETTIDSLVLTDITRVEEGETHDKYKLVFKEGTLVLVKLI